MKGDLGLLRERNFLLFFLARTSSPTGNVIAPLGLAFAVLAMPDGSPSKLELLLGTRTVAPLGLILLGGVLADRFSRQRLITVGEATAECSQALTAALPLHGSVPMNVLIALAAVNGASSAVSQPAATALVPTSSTPNAPSRRTHCCAWRPTSPVSQACSSAEYSSRPSHRAGPQPPTPPPTSFPPCS